MSSDWRVRANERRDARHTKTPVEVPKPAAANKKKDTRRWCRGKVGVEHTPKCVDYGEAKHAPTDYCGHPVNHYEGWKLLICTTCGKELDRFCPWRWVGEELPKPPAWVK
jgi:hypothetical protein